jgi:hypothetical protein
MNKQEILSRFEYKPPTDKQRHLLKVYHELTMACATFLVDYLPESRDRSLALTSLEDTRMKVNKAIVFSEFDNE